MIGPGSRSSQPHRIIGRAKTRIRVMNRPTFSLRRSGTASNQIDLDDAAARQMCNADRGPCGQPVGPEIFGVEPVERGVVALEIGEKDAHADDMLGARERALEIIHHLAGLRLDPLRQRQRMVVRAWCKRFPPIQDLDAPILFEKCWLGAADERVQGLAVPDHDGTAPSVDDPGRAPQGELFVNCLAADADHISEIVLRHRDGDIGLFRSAIMLREDQQPLC